MKIFDCHSDTMADIRNRVFAGEHDVIRNRHLPLYDKGGVSGLLYAIYLDADLGDPQRTMLEILRTSFVEFDAVQDRLAIGYTAGDLARIMDGGRTAVLLGLEGLDGLGTEPDWLHTLYHLGFRHAMLTWSTDNAFAAGSAHEGPGDGLTDLGAEALRLMERLGMLVDVSHASEKTFWDVVAHTEKPFIASHSNAWSLCHAKRNLKDDQIRAIAERGGVIGMNAWGSFIDPVHATVDRLADHAAYIADLVGAEHVACGFDFCGYLSEDDPDTIANETPELANSGDCLHFIDALRRRGFSETDIDGIASGNFLRVLGRVVG